MNELEMGVTVKDAISGFMGIVTGKAEYITGCTQYLISPKCTQDANSKPESFWLDDGRLEVIEEEGKLMLAGMSVTLNTGGPQSHPAPRK